MPKVSAEDRKEQFVEAAVRVIAEVGVGSATTRRIAEAARAPLASLHYCFSGKDELFLAVFSKLAEDALDPIELEVGGDLAVAAEHLFRRTIDWFMEHEEYTLAEIDLYMWFTRNDRSLASKANDMFEASFVDTIAVACPEVSTDAILSVARVLIPVVDGLTVEWASYRDRNRVKEAVDSFAAAIPVIAAQATQGALVAR
jgi:AcrR family transcriptional regulator